MAKLEGGMGDLPGRIDWGDQGTLTDMVKKLIPGHWHECHRTILSRKCAEQKVRTRELRTAPNVQALAEEDIEKTRGDVAQINRAQMESASTLQSGLELVMTVPREVERLAMEVRLESSFTDMGFK
ncbi:hypothetical protein CYMTET_46918 [Cymbomonas tetramitiformis]|uniref:Uncharacterized protein n=1 Tax=Cymbomonas tetramitiformis TaxID=36881 RepID=A0AAE0BV84_9CHLO|nr:hypothetical protein CYMTET_46918 [Cymbomonas tetramitiformis]